MSRYLSRAHVRNRRPLVAVAAAVAGAAVSGVVTPAPAQAALTINLQFPTGATTMLIGGDQTNTSIPIQVWATVTGANNVTTTAGATTGDFDGVQFAYYNILNSNNAGSGSQVAGGFSSTTLNGTLGFNANGAQAGFIQNNTSSGISIGYNGSVGSIAKPRAAKGVFDNASTSTSQIQVSGGSASFLLETLNYTPTAYAQRNKTTFTAQIPTVAQLQANGILTQANWFEDTTNQSNGSMNNQPTPVTSNKDGTPTAGTQVVLQDTLAGDTNLDGTVNFADLLTVDQNYNKTGTTFATGDFNGDGTTNFADLLALDQNYNMSVGGVTPSEKAQLLAIGSPLFDAALGATGLVSVPEPATLSLVAAVGAATLLRRRRPA